MDTNGEIDSIIKKILPEIDKRFVNKDEKRNLREFLIASGFGSKERFIKLILKKIGSSDNMSQIPSVNSLESLMYGVIGQIKPKDNLQINPGMESAGLKFIRTFTKIAFSEADVNNNELKDINSRFKLALSSMVQNDGENPEEVLSFLDKNQLTPELIMQYHKNDEQLNEDLLMQTTQFNLRYVLNKPGYLFKLSYNEIKALSQAYNTNQKEIRIAGELIKLSEVSQLKIFTINDVKSFDNEVYLSGTLMPEAKKLYNIGDWTYERLSKFGEDVTSKFLVPITSDFEIKKNEQPLNNSNKIVHIHCNDCHHYTNHSVSVEHKEREIVPEVVDGRTIEFWIDHHFQILKCGSCNEFTYKTWQIWSEDVPDFTPSNIKILPKRGKSTIRKSDSFNSVPSHIIGIYKETYDALINKTSLLCAGGIRAILEAICIEKSIKEGTVPSEGANPEKRTSSLKGKIYGLYEKGLITKRHADILVHHQYLGDKALHECEKPSSEELEIAIQIIALTLSSVYELSQKGEELINKKKERTTAEE